MPRPQFSLKTLLWLMAVASAFVDLVSGPLALLRLGRHLAVVNV
jgi:hypothetical protein